MVGAVGDESCPIDVDGDTDRIEELRRRARSILMSGHAAASECAHVPLWADGPYAMVAGVGDKDGAVGAEGNAIPGRVGETSTTL